ncbi:MAG: lactate racemase domain-containing protein [Candidatus Aerophobetes bacterium]|nr:lactate racemase domain-containing protein [Candidatus Aerophobetes bacterium]
MNIQDWKRIGVEYGKDILTVKVPPYCDILTMGHVPSLAEPAKKIENALSNPIGSKTIEDIVASSKKHPFRVVVAVIVSDNTRPVPYNAGSGEGILFPILKRLKKVGVRNENIRIIVGTGTHLPTSSKWKKEALGEAIADSYTIIDHDSTSPDLFSIGNVDGIEVKINKEFITADVRIATGLVEPHFTAGVSGGRKAICPGLMNLEATYLFHGVEFTDNRNSTNLVLENNPCHKFALKVARKVGGGLHYKSYYKWGWKIDKPFLFHKRIKISV